MNILSNYRVPREVEIYTGKAIRPAIGCLVFFLIVFPDILRLIPRDFSLLKLILSLFPLPVCSLLILGSIAGFRDLPGWNKQLLWKPGHYFSWSLTFKMFLFNFILSLLLVHLMQKIGELLRISIPPQPLGQILAQSSPLACIIIGFAVIILAPQAEELLYRHVIFNQLVPKTGTLWAVILVSLFFSVSHMNLLQAPSLFCMGFILQLAYLHNHSLLSPVMIHSLFNAASFISILLMR